MRLHVAGERAMKKILTFCITAALLAMAAHAAQDPESIEGLTKVRSKNADLVYLRPGVDFRTYTKVMLDQTEVSFRPGWQRSYNNTVRGGRRINDDDMARAADQVRTGFGEIFAQAYSQGGYQVVTEAGPDVLRLRTGVINLYVSAPERMTAGISRTYSVEAGEATLVIEARDSQTGALLGRLFDLRTAGDISGLRNSVSNRADFTDLFRTWARASVRGLDALKARSPVQIPAAR
jgi:hypothetical protein